MEATTPPAIATPQRSADRPIYEVLPNGNVRIIYLPSNKLGPFQQGAKV